MREKGRLPKKPRCADSGEGWGDVMIAWQSEIKLIFFSAGLPHNRKPILVLSLLTKLSNHGIGEFFPALTAMRVGLTFPDRQYGVQQQNSLPRPRAQIARDGLGNADVLRQLFENVPQRRGNSTIRRSPKNSNHGPDPVRGTDPGRG